MQDERLALRRLVNGFQVSQAIYAAVALGVPDLLKDGARGSDELSVATGADSDALYRLLRALASVGVLREDGRKFALTPLGDGLRSDAPDSLAGWVALVGRPYFWSSWGTLFDSVRSGENAFRRLHGTDVWSWRSERPEETAVFDGAMTALTRITNRSVLEAYDFGRFGTVVDVGGGRGAFLSALLAAYPAMQGVLFDQAHVVAAAAGVLAEAGIADRCRVVAGSFFEAVPEGGDAYVLKAIIHDWEDDESGAILRACRAAAAAGTTLLLLERELGGPNERPDSKFSDLNMLVMPGGRERTLDEYASLLASAGYELRGATPTASGVSVIEAVAA